MNRTDYSGWAPGLCVHCGVKTHFRDTAHQFSHKACSIKAEVAQ